MHILFSSWFELQVIICIVATGYVFYATYVAAFKKQPVFKELLKGLLIGFCGHLLVFISIVLLRNVGVSVDVIAPLNYYLILSVFGNILFFVLKKPFIGMGILISLPLTLAAIFLFTMISGSIWGN